MTRQLLLAILASGVLTGGVGCHHFCRKHRDRDVIPPPPSVIPGTLGDPLPPRTGRIPPPDVPTTPPPVLPDSPSGSYFRPGDPGPSPGSWVPPVDRSRSAFGPELLPPTRPKGADSKKELLLPEPIPGGSKAPPPSIDLPGDKKPDVRGYLEEPVRPNDTRDLPPTVVPEKTDPSTSSAPVGLPGFSKVPGREGVATGRKPTLDGFDWLKANRYKTVVYLHAPGADVSAARDLAASRGLRFVAIPVSPATLKTAFEEFRTTIADASIRPVYVADEDGTRAGGLWYLLFRTVDLMNDDAARVRAAPLGLSDAVTEDEKQLWLAIQNYLATR